MDPLENDSSYSVSTVIPAYNAEAYIGRAIDSVLAQGHPADEIIVVDDGSTDGTGAVVKKYGENVRYICLPNAGASAARNAGIKAAKSGWIAFLDSDDEWLPENLELQLALLQRNKHLLWSTANFVRCNCNTETKVNDLRGEMLDKAKSLIGDNEYFESYFKAFEFHAVGCCDNMVIRRDVLIESGLFTVGQLRINDMDMWFRIAYRYPQIGYVFKETAIAHRDVPDSITKTYTDSNIIDSFLQRHLMLAAEHNHADDFKPCAEIMLRWWIHWMLKAGHAREVRGFLKKYHLLLGHYFRMTAYIYSLFPKLAGVYESIKTGCRNSYGRK